VALLDGPRTAPRSLRRRAPREGDQARTGRQPAEPFPQ
jgi:hypothetical protein